MSPRAGELRLTLLSYPGHLDRFFEGVAAALYPRVDERFCVERCQHPADALHRVERWRKRGYAITRLDLVGHGRPGAFALGDELMFNARRWGLALARELGEHLAAGARVQLFGCRLLGDRGARWLAPFEAVLGPRQTLRACDWWLTARDFGGGLTPHLDRRLTPVSGVFRPEARRPRRAGRFSRGSG